MALNLDTLFDSDADNSVQSCKAGSGVLYGFEASQANAADAFLQLFDAATGDVTVGTTSPKLSYFIPAGDGTLRGSTEKNYPEGIKFSTAITYAVTTTPAGSTDPTAGINLNVVFL